MDRKELWSWIVFGLAVLAILWLGVFQPAHAHDIYSGVHGKTGNLCCGGDPITGDCTPAPARARGGFIEFIIHPPSIRKSYSGMADITISVPDSEVTFLPIPGEEKQSLPPAPVGYVYGHYCGRPSTFSAPNVYNEWYTYCSFYPPGSS